MKSNVDYYNNKEIYLNLTDLLFFYMRRWKSLIVFVLVLAVLGGMGGRYAKIGNTAATEEEIREYSISSSVKANMDTAYRYQQLYDRQTEYTQESILMNLDFSKIYTGSLKYFIYAGPNTSNYGTQFTNLMDDEELLESLKKVTGCSDVSYIRELVSTSTSYPSTTAADGSTIVSTESMAVTFLFYASSSDVCQSMIDVVSEKGDNLAMAFSAAEEGYSVLNAGESISVQANTVIRDQQSTNANLLSSYANSLAKCTEDFSEKQQAYYEVVYLGKEVPSGSTQKVSVKSILIAVVVGAFLGFLLWICYGVACYLLDKHVKHAEEMNERHGLKLIGRYCPHDFPADKIEKWHEGWKGRKLGPANDADYFVSVLDLLNENICLIGKAADEAVREFGEKIASSCENIVYDNLVQCDSLAMQKAKKAGKVVLLVHRGETTYMEVRRELEIYSLQGIQVIGTIMIE